MVWVKLDDRFTENRKVVELSDRAFRLHVTALCYASRELTDGAVSENAALRICDGTRKAIADLIAAGLWRRAVAGGYLIHDFLKYNPTAEDVEEARRQRSAAGKKGAKRRWGGDGGGDSDRHNASHSDRHSPSMANGKQNECPVPVPEEEEISPGAVSLGKTEQPLTAAQTEDPLVADVIALSEVIARSLKEAS